MPDFPVSPTTTPLLISSYSRYAEPARFLFSSPTTITWPVANLGIYIPFTLPFAYPVRRVWWYNGTDVTTTNMDLGIYTATGVRIYSTGPTAASGASATQFVTPTAFVLPPGQYYFARSCSSSTASRGGIGITAATRMINFNRMTGCLQQSSVGTLPATMTGVSLAQAVYPLFGITRTTSGF